MMKDALGINRAATVLMSIMFAFVVRVSAADDSGPSKDPLQAAALARMNELAAALTQCAADTGFYVSLETLNDGTNSQVEPPYDYLNDQGGSFVLDPANGAFTDARMDIAGDWGGPYLSYAPGSVQSSGEPYDQGSPLDPWDNPYYLFSPLGLARADGGTLTPELYGDDFDRFTIVSLGPDGEAGGGDDLAFQFGAALSNPALSDLSGEGVMHENRLWQATGGVAVTLRGYALGEPQGAGRLVFGEVELTQIDLWRATRIDLTLPTDVEGRRDLFVDRDDGQLSNSLPLRISIPRNAAGLWELYP